MTPDLGEPQQGRRDAVRIQILGPLRVWRGDTEIDAGPHQQRCLLGLLAAREGSPVGVGELVEQLWGPESPPSAVNIIHKYVGLLRRLLEPELPPRARGSYLARHGSAYCFTANRDMLDLIQFRTLVTEATACVGRDELDAALDRYVRALRLGHGPAGDELGRTSAARATFTALDDEFSDAIISATEIGPDRGRVASLLVPVRRAADRHPLNELVQRSLVMTLAAAGRQAEALTVYRTIAERLARELGVDPGPELQDAYHRVLTDTVRPIGGAVSPSSPVRPAQLPPDLLQFTGRRQELAALRRLTAGASVDGRAGPGVIAMHGLDGVGKSALAVRFAHLVADHFTDGQLHLDLRGNRSDEEGLSADEALLSLLYGLGARATEVPETFDARMGMYRSLTAGRRMLLLLDNVRDSAQVRPLLPSSAGSLVLLSSRRPLLDLAARDGARLMRVDVPDAETARELLRSRLAGFPQEPATTRHLDDIVDVCGRLPLALAVVAAKVTARPNLSLASAATELRNGRARANKAVDYRSRRPGTPLRSIS